MANIFSLSRVATSNEAIVRDHFARHGALSTREAMALYHMTGGTFTKVISAMRAGSNARIERNWIKCNVTGRRYANYTMVPAPVVAG